MFIPVEERALVQQENTEVDPKKPRARLMVTWINGYTCGVSHCMGEDQYVAVAAMLAESVEIIKAKFALAIGGNPQVLKRESREILCQIFEHLSHRVCTCAFRLSIHDE